MIWPYKAIVQWLEIMKPSLKIFIILFICFISKPSLLKLFFFSAELELDVAFYLSCAVCLLFLPP